MNLIEAYKKAKEGDILFRASDDSSYSDSSIKYQEDFSLLVNEYTLSNEDWLADDWYIERKPLVWEGEVVWFDFIDSNNDMRVFPSGGKDGQDSNEEIKDLFYNKRTNIRIEEIMEEE